MLEGRNIGLRGAVETVGPSVSDGKPLNATMFLFTHSRLMTQFQVTGLNPTELYAMCLHFFCDDKDGEVSLK